MKYKPFRQNLILIFLSLSTINLALCNKQSFPIDKRSGLSKFLKTTGTLYTPSSSSPDFFKEFKSFISLISDDIEINALFNFFLSSFKIFAS